MKIALEIPDDRYLLFATVDTVVGAVYLLFVLTLAPKVFGWFLKSADTIAEAEDQPEVPHAPTSWQGWAIQGAIALVAAVICVQGAVIAAGYLHWVNQQIITIVLITTFALALSFVPRLRANRAATPMGMFLIYVFSFCVAASMDLAQLANVEWSILMFVLVATVGSFVLHAVLCRLFSVDRDTFLITSVAAVMSPAFVPMVARSLGNPAMLMSGMAAGILGFAIGNYLGITLAVLLA